MKQQSLVELSQIWSPPCFFKDMKDVKVKADHVEFLTDVVAQTYW